ncbi:MAG: KUP/HAK/KT family potassium transporter [Scardovia wiggsiae]|uniref:KUP/HAK/KT family potassium transporter n=1 Tax=Scardovia wiggsiae TaxID=230143 RepID=UPI003615D653
MAQQDSKRVSRMAAENGNGGGSSTDGHKQASGQRRDAGEGRRADQNSSTGHNASPQGSSEGHSGGTGLDRDAGQGIGRKDGSTGQEDPAGTGPDPRSGIHNGQGNDKGLQHLVHDTDLAKAVNAAPRSSTPQKKISPASKEAKPAEVAAVLDETGSIIPEEEIISGSEVSEEAISQEEREETERAKEEARKSARMKTVKARTPLGRWWNRVQASPDKISLGMCIVTMGVVYGDIGTSPLYLSQSFVAGQGGIRYVDRASVLGMLSLLFWSITLITTVKYVLIAMRIDNKGEGGIFALYSMVKRFAKWLWIPAMVGGAAFLADSVLTPAVSISSAVEGLKTLPAIQGVFSRNGNLTVIITVVIIVILFAVQSRGTERIGRVFGIVVAAWFTFMAVVGVISIGHDWSVFEALNPWYGLEYLLNLNGANRAGIAIMGTVFLATTGAEALYSDMGHVGRGNVYATWPFIFICLVFNYFGQGAWMIRNQNNRSLWNVENLNPFFQTISPNLRYVAVILSVAAGVIASQALITGAFTMVSEATGLNWMPHLQVRYPARTRGQLYIPLVNFVLCAATLIVLLLFRDSERITNAYGLALTITMIATVVLLMAHMWFVQRRRLFAVIFGIVFLAIQTLFFISSLSKFFTGGWFTTIITLLIFFIMYTWDTGTKVERSQRRHMAPEDFLPALNILHQDKSVPLYADNLVYLTSDSELRRLDTDIFFSIFADHPKRAHAWWAVSVLVTDDPYTREYSVENFGTDFLFRVRVRIGFKVNQNISTYLHQIMHELIDSGTLPPQETIYPKIDNDPQLGTINYVLIHKALMPESKIDTRGAFSLRVKYAIRRVAGSPVKWFGLSAFNPKVEVQPLFVRVQPIPPLKYVPLRKTKRPITLEAILTRKAEQHKADTGEIDPVDIHTLKTVSSDLREEADDAVARKKFL